MEREEVEKWNKMETAREGRVAQEKRGRERERAGGQRYTQPAMKYSIFNQTPSTP